jgi:hypothetical protein
MELDEILNLGEVEKASLHEMGPPLAHPIAPFPDWMEGDRRKMRVPR